jgi:hypothetical protein
MSVMKGMPRFIVEVSPPNSAAEFTMTPWFPLMPIPLRLGFGAWVAGGKRARW